MPTAAILQEIHVGDFGTVLTDTLTNSDDDTIVDISSALEQEFRFRKPNGTVVEKTTVFVTDGTDGKVKYVAESGLFDVAGVWKRQTRIKDGVSEWFSNVLEFRVHENV